MKVMSSRRRPLNDKRPLIDSASVYTGMGGDRVSLEMKDIRVLIDV